MESNLTKPEVYAPKEPGKFDSLRRAATFMGKVVFAAGTFGVVGVGLISFADSKVNDTRVAAKSDADQFLADAKRNADQLLIDTKVMGCATGNQLIVNFNSVSVNPLIQEAAGIKNNTGTIAELLPRVPETTTTTTTVTTDETQPTGTVTDEEREPELSPPTTEPLKPEGSYKELSSPCPPPSAESPTAQTPPTPSQPEPVPQQLAGDTLPVQSVPPQG